MIVGTKEIERVDANLTSPTYNTSKTHCLSFEYEVVGKGTPGSTVNSPALNVYSRCQSNLFAGEKIWNASQISRGVVEITVLSTERVVDCFIDYVGRLGDAKTDKVALANVLFKDGLCDDSDFIACQDGDFVCENDLTCGSASSRCNNMASCPIDARKLQCGENYQGPDSI